jgi:hypothetical protein
LADRPDRGVGFCDTCERSCKSKRAHGRGTGEIAAESSPPLNCMLHNFLRLRFSSSS